MPSDASLSRLALADWRRQTAELYTAVRRSATLAAAWHHFVARRSEMFQTHAQSPLTDRQRTNFQQLDYFPYNPAFRVRGRLDFDVARTPTTIELAADGRFTYESVAAVHFELQGQSARLNLFWITGYGGGLFLPFKDATNKRETFGGGRYLYDTIKGADLGASESSIPLDFNFAYNPSCAYNGQWICPLSPPENTLSLRISAGEKSFHIQAQ